MTRNANIYVSSQLRRWLGWLAEMRSEEGSHTADSVAEEILRQAITANVPNIDEVEADYCRARQKLDREAIGKMGNADMSGAKPK